jgi:hypothetical protein
MTEQGLTSPQGTHQLASRFDISLMSGAISPISVRTLVSASNALYTGSILAPTTTFSTAGSGSSTNTTPDLSGPFSETVVYEIVANGEGGANVAIDISTILSSAPPSVPEPASLVLLGVGLAGVGLFFRRRKAGVASVIIR